MPKHPTRPAKHEGPIAIISCSKSKLAVPAPAYLLYSRSSLFCKSYQHAKTRYSKVLIASAEHGIIDPRQWVSPYDTTLKDLTPAERECWFEKAKGTLDNIPHDGIKLYAGALYLKLLSRLPNVTQGVSGPIGKRMQKLGIFSPLTLHPMPKEETLLLVYRARSEGIRTSDLQSRLMAAGLSGSGAGHEVRRATQCPLHTIVKNRIISKAYSQDCL